MTPPSITAIIVSYNSVATVLDALAALEDAHRVGHLDCVVVDNNSADATVSAVEERFPWVMVVAQDENVGFGCGCNVGIERATTPYLLFLNPDALLPASELEKLMEFMEAHPRAGVVAPAIHEPGGELQHAGGLPSPFGRLEVEPEPSVASRPRTIHPGDAPFRTNWVCGALVLIRSQVLRDVGGFDPRFFLYYEETDLFRRAQHGGWEIWAHGGAEARHVTAGSAAASNQRMYEGCIAEHYFQSRFYYLGKHFGWVRAASSEALDYLVNGARALGRILTGRDTGASGVRLRAGFLRLPRVR